MADIERVAHVQAAAAIEGYRSVFPPDAPRPTPEALQPSWRNLIDNPSAVVKVAVAPSPIGVVVLRGSAGVPSGQLLERLYVEPDWWGRGVGARLHDEALAVAAERDSAGMNLWVLEGNARARSMYERRGCVLVPGRTLTHAAGVVEVLSEIDLRFA